MRSNPPQTGDSAYPRRTPQGSQPPSRRQTRRYRHGKSWKAKRPAGWSNHKRLSSSITRDVASVEVWDEEIEEQARLAKEADAQQSEDEDWDAPESQTDPGNGLTWDETITRDHGVAPSWVERQEQERIDRSLPWRCDPEGSMWQRDPSPR